MPISGQLCGLSNSLPFTCSLFLSLSLSWIFCVFLPLPLYFSFPSFLPSPPSSILCIVVSGRCSELRAPFGCVGYMYVYLVTSIHTQHLIISPVVAGAGDILENTVWRPRLLLTAFLGSAEGCFFWTREWPTKGMLQQRFLASNYWSFLFLTPRHTPGLFGPLSPFPPNSNS